MKQSERIIKEETQTSRKMKEIKDNKSGEKILAHKRRKREGMKQTSGETEVINMKQR
jgi:cell division protein FtsL